MNLLLAVLLSFASPARAEEWSARLSAVSGTVLLHVGGDEEGLPAEAGTPLEAGDRVETGADGTAEIALEADSVIELGAHTSFTVGSMKMHESWFSLNVGSFLAKLKSFQARRAAMHVRTPTAVAAVRGTEFGLEVGEDGETNVGVFDEGRVGVTHGEGGGSETVLTAKQEATLKPGESAFAVRRLERLEKRRGRIAHLRARREHLRKGWSHIPPERRRELREKWRGGQRERMGKMPPERREKALGGIREHRKRVDERREGFGERKRQGSPDGLKELRRHMKEKRGERREGLKGRLEDRRERRRGDKKGGGDRRR